MRSGKPANTPGMWKTTRAVTPCARRFFMTAPPRASIAGDWKRWWYAIGARLRRCNQPRRIKLKSIRARRCFAGTESSISSRLLASEKPMPGLFSSAADKIVRVVGVPAPLVFGDLRVRAQRARHLHAAAGIVAGVFGGDNFLWRSAFFHPPLQCAEDAALGSARTKLPDRCSPRSADAMLHSGHHIDAYELL